MTAGVWERAAQRVEAEATPRTWDLIARPEQRAPEGEWLVWAFIAGRGAGKTRSMAEWVTEQVTRHGRKRVALVGRTPADVRDVMIEGESGLLAVANDAERPVYEPSKRRLTWPNGAIATAYSAEVPSQLRGPQHDLAWVDEPAAWTDSRKGDVLDTTWNNLMLGLRLGSNPQCGFSTTPKNVKLVRQVLARDTTRVSKGSTYDNLANLAPVFREQVLAAYEGTRIGRQELLGELLEDVEGALWSLMMIEQGRVTVPQENTRVVVAVDPAMTSGEDSDETGIIVAAKGIDAEGYILADRSCKLSPDGWARRVVAAYDEFRADRIVIEDNQGGETVEHTLRTVRRGLPITRVHAKHGKRTRAEPVAALYEQSRVHHVGAHAQLEDQMTQWVADSGDSPDRVDALVYAITALGITGGGQGEAFLEHWKNQQPETAQPGTSAADLHRETAKPLVKTCKHHYFDGHCTNCGQPPPTP